MTIETLTGQKVPEEHFARGIGALISIAQFPTMNQEREKRLQGDRREWQSFFAP